MHTTHAARTDTGKKRPTNEDFFVSHPEEGIFIVCDGMGGHKAGDVASRLTAAVITRELQAAKDPLEKFQSSGNNADCQHLKNVVRQAVIAACTRVHEEGVQNPDQAGMGTTCTLVWLVGHNKGILGHVGDSRLYLARSGQLHQLSEDHTLINELVKQGALSPIEAKNHPRGNILSRAIGTQPTVSVDTMIFDVDPLDTFLLCSDGLYNHFETPEELHALLTGENLAENIEDLVDTALKRGGTDNITAIAFRSTHLSPEDQPLSTHGLIEALRNTALFAHLSYQELVRVLAVTIPQKFAPGTLLIKEGQENSRMYVILEGEVEVVKGEEVLTLLGPGANLGEMAMLDNSPRSASVRTRSELRALSIERSEFLRILHPNLAGEELG